MINKLFDKAVKDISKRYKDVILNVSRNEVSDKVTFNLKHYNKQSKIEVDMSEIYRASFPEEYVLNILEEHIKMLRCS